MLLSARIASDSSFLHTDPLSQLNARELRSRIFRSTKILVSPEIYNHYDFGLSEIDEKTRLHYNNVKQYREYFRLPFNSMFIENETGGLLVEPISEQVDAPKQGTAQGITVNYDVIVTLVYNDGYIHNAQWSLPLYDDLKNTKDFLSGFILSQAAREYAIYNYPRIPDDQMDKKFFTSWDAFINFQGLTFMYEIMSVILFFNVQNKVIKTYQATHADIPALPKNSLPWYEYRILDLYSTTNQYLNLAAVEEEVNTKHGDSSRRASMRRGHFRHGKKHKKLWWTSEHMVNRKNLGTHGYIEKGYELHPDGENEDDD